eukprot:CAMPEP_0180306916 /NCGR_PEP_ID=MMETSP0988-20121125/27395_1 /TAXON_ID=697907 /ORGANISM="non described non described, Strain CCMP2293" /LENGTH=285 /DNA_ID=CAMNT_0022289809 /DNA_START=167 /DNA_END=1025 /DNA_ORIENTATION=-
MAMNLSAGAQIVKQKEMRDERKRSGPGVTAPGRAAQKLIPLNLETKWKAPAPRSAQCEGCGPGKWSPSGAPSSRAWKCGPCARALEEAYMTRLERLAGAAASPAGGGDGAAGRRQHRARGGHTALRGADRPPANPALRERGAAATSHAYLEQLLAHVEQQEKQYKGVLALHNDTMGENARLHSTTEEASKELERTAHVTRDLEYANKVVRDENQVVQHRVQALLDTVGTLREELRAQFKTVQQTQANAAAERHDWHSAMKTLEGENEDLRRRLQWLERSAAASKP